MDTGIPPSPHYRIKPYKLPIANQTLTESLLNSECDKKCLTVLYGCILLVAFIILITAIWLIHKRKQQKMKHYDFRRKNKRENSDCQNSLKIRRKSSEIPPSKSSGRRFSWYRPASIFDREKKLSRISERTEPSTSIKYSSSNQLEIFNNNIHQSNSSVFSTNITNNNITPEIIRSKSENEKLVKNWVSNLFKKSTKTKNTSNLELKNEDTIEGSLLKTPGGSTFRKQIELCRGELPQTTKNQEYSLPIPKLEISPEIEVRNCNSPSPPDQPQLSFMCQSTVISSEIEKPTSYLDLCEKSEEGITSEPDKKFCVKEGHVNKL